MGLSAKILPNYRYRDYLNWEGRWELIEGIPYAMSPMPSPRHQELAGKVHAIFLQALQEAGCPNCRVYQPIDLKMDEHTVIHPDLLVVCKPIEKPFLDFPPALVAEILSEPTRLKDRQTKFELYQDFGIPYYLMIDPEKQSIEVFRRNEEGKYEQVQGAPHFLLDEDCRISPRLASIWDG